MALRRLLEAANSDMGFTNQEKGMQVFSSTRDCAANIVKDFEECCHTSLVLSVRSWRISQQAFSASPSRAASQDQVMLPTLAVFSFLFVCMDSFSLDCCSQITCTQSLSHTQVSCCIDAVGSWIWMRFFQHCRSSTFHAFLCENTTCRQFTFVQRWWKYLPGCCLLLLKFTLSKSN